MNTDLFELLLASGRAFTVTLPDGTRVEVPAVTPADSNDSNDDSKKPAFQSAQLKDNSNEDTFEKPLNDSAPQGVADGVTPDAASSEGNSNDSKSELKTAPDSKVCNSNSDSKVCNPAVTLKPDEQTILSEFAGRGAVHLMEVATFIDQSPQLAAYRLNRLVAKTGGLVTKGEHRGEYTFRTIPESAVGAGAEPHVDGDDAPKGPTTLASNRDGEPTQESLLLMNISANVKSESLCKKTNKRNTKYKTQEYGTDFSDGHKRSDAPTTPPAPAVSPKPPDIDELDEDERDAYDAEEFAAGRAHPRTRPRTPTPTRPRPRYTPLPPKRRPYVPAYAPVVTEDDYEDEPYDPD